MIRKIICLFLFIGLNAANGVGQQGSISVNSKVDKSTIRIGDLITYSVLVKSTPDINVEMPMAGANLDSFEIRDYKVHDKTEEDGFELEQVDYVISTFEVGEFEIPPLAFYYTFAEDSTRHELKTKKIKIRVESIKPSESGDIRDVKNPLSLPRDYKTLIFWGSIGFAFLALIGVLIYIWYRKRTGKSLIPQKVEPPRPAHEIALEKLIALKTSSLLKDGKVKEFYIQLSGIIRQYIEGRYFIVAMELTTFELIENLRNSEIESEPIQMIQDFLENCDWVKFAKYLPTEDENIANTEAAFQIVEQTKLIYDEVEVEGNGEEIPGETESIKPGEGLEENVEEVK